MSRNLIDRLDPELKAAVGMMMSQPPMSFDDLPKARAASSRMTAVLKMQEPVIPGVITESRTIPGPKGAPDISIRIYRSEKRRSGLSPALLWIHGGGYMMGNLDQDDPMAKNFALAGDCVTVSVEYRLAPEHPYPAPLEDCYSALKWLAANAKELGVDHSRIGIGGGSAGGGLAAGLALLGRDRAEINVIFQLLVYPMINDCNIIPASEVLPDTILWTRAANRIGWRSYLGCEPGGEGISGYAAASRAANLEGLPTTYIAVGDLDLFAQEDVEYARRLIAAGVSTELHVYPGGCHAFDMMVPNADISKRFTADIYRALKKALHS